MRIYRTLLLMVALPGLLLCAPGYAQPTYHGCSLEGNAKSARVRALNRLKNREVAPTPAQIDPRITLKAMVVPGNDRRRWKSSQGATITGYVADVHPGGVETVNCDARDRKYRDTHIGLVVDPMDKTKQQQVIVEVTPRWRAKMAADGKDWSTTALRQTLLGRWVKITGWMMFDAEHANASENTAPGRARNWRATAWEIHPITAIEVLKARPR